MLPEKDGLTLPCREIRQFSDVPIMMVTAKTEEIDHCWGWKSVRMITSASLTVRARWWRESNHSAPLSAQ